MSWKLPFFPVGDNKTDIIWAKTFLSCLHAEFILTESLYQHSTVLRLNTTYNVLQDSLAKIIHLTLPPSIHPSIHPPIHHLYWLSFNAYREDETDPYWLSEKWGPPWTIYHRAYTEMNNHSDTDLHLWPIYSSQLIDPIFGRKVQWFEETHIGIA